MPDQMPPLDYVRGPCQQCGALTEREADRMCTQTQDETGEYSCAGDFRRGYSYVPTPESVKILDEWIDRRMRAETNT